MQVFTEFEPAFVEKVTTLQTDKQKIVFNTVFISSGKLFLS